MKFALLLRVTAVVLIFSGAAVLLFPVWVLSLYGTTLTPGGLVLARSFGAAYVALGILAWQLTGIRQPAARQGFSLGFIACFGSGFVVFFVAQLQGVYNALGWFDVLLNGFLAAAFIYHIMNPEQT